MKSFYQSMLIAVLVLGSVSCNKKDTTDERVVTSEEDYTLFTKAAIRSMDNQEVYSDNPELGIYMIDEGIAPCFLADATDLTGDDSQRTRIRRNCLITCLRGLSLNETQIPLVREDLRRYNACNETAINRARAIYNELQASYRQKYNRLNQAYQSGGISGEEFRAKVAELRTAFKRELRSLHLREKLDEALTRCLRTFLVELRSTLNDRQWNAFKECFTNS